MILQTTSDNGELFTFLGDEYHYVGKNSCPVRFKELAANKFVGDLPNVIDKLYAFIIYERGKGCVPLYDKNYYYILTDAGVHFQCLSLRPD